MNRLKKLLVEGLTRALGWKKTFFYERYHHFLLHGFLGTILITMLVACFAHRKGRVALLALLVFHLHLLCDFVGSRGPNPADLWPLFYFGPARRNTRDHNVRKCQPIRSVKTKFDLCANLFALLPFAETKRPINKPQTI